MLSELCVSVYFWYLVMFVNCEGSISSFKHSLELAKDDDLTRVILWARVPEPPINLVGITFPSSSSNTAQHTKHGPSRLLTLHPVHFLTTVLAVQPKVL